MDREDVLSGDEVSGQGEFENRKFIIFFHFDIGGGSGIVSEGPCGPVDRGHFRSVEEGHESVVDLRLEPETGDSRRVNHVELKAEVDRSVGPAHHALDVSIA